MPWFEAFHFMRPIWLLALVALVPLAALLALSWHSSSRSGGWQQLIDPELMPFLLDSAPTGSRRWPYYLLALSWLLATIGLAGPSWQQLPTPVYEKDDVLVLILDNTASMLAQDSKPSRVTHAAREIQDILQYRQEGRTALITYSADAFIVSPLTRDTNTIALLAKSLSPEIMPAIGNQPIAAFEIALNMVKQIPNANILWLTDEVPNSDSNEIIKRVNESNVKLAIMGIGTTTGAPIPLPSRDGFLKARDGSLVVPKLNRTELQRIARQTNGKYSDSKLNDDDIKHLLADDTLDTDTATTLNDLEFDNWRDESWLLALILLLPTALAFRQGNLLLISLVCLPLLYSPQSHAGWWQDLWQTKNQQGQAAFQQGDAKTAQQLFQDPPWQAAAAYKAEAYEAAEQAFSKPETPQDWYNYGNALAKNQKLPEAIKAYEQALAQQPDMEDAAFNKNLLEDLLNQQQSSENQNDEQNPDQQDSDQQNQDSQQGDSADDQQQADSSQNSQEQNQQSSEQTRQNAENEQTPAEEEATEESTQASEAEQDEATTAAEQLAAEEADENATEQAEQPLPALPAQLRTIEDEPGGLLRRKFADQANQRQRNNSGEQRW